MCVKVHLRVPAPYLLAGTHNHCRLRVVRLITLLRLLRSRSVAERLYRLVGGSLGGGRCSL